MKAFNKMKRTKGIVKCNQENLHVIMKRMSFVQKYAGYTNTSHKCNNLKVIYAK